MEAWQRQDFLFPPGLETDPTYYVDEVKLVLKNAVRWARPEGLWVDACPNIPVENAPEKIIPRGESVH